MRRTTAAVAVSAIGAVGAGFAASPAQAMPADTCDAYTDHVVTDEGSLDPDWYMECVPQYGAGKVEFMVTPDMDFPADYERDFTDPSVETTTSLDTAAVTTYGFPLENGAFFDLSVGVTGLDYTQYTAAMVAPIAGVQSILVSDLPAGCDVATNTYANAYRVDYEAVSTTFSQQAGGETWTSEVALTPEPLFLGFTPDPTDGSVDGTVCVQTGDNGTVRAAGSGSRDDVIADYITHDPDDDYSLGSVGGLGGTFGYFLGDFVPVHAVATVPDPGTDAGATPDPDPAPDNDDDALLPDTGRDAARVLPDTGSDVAAGPGWAALGALVAGGALVALGRRRTVRHHD